MRKNAQNSLMQNIRRRKPREAWIENAGGLKKATSLVAKILDCGFSKAEKVATNRYVSQLSPQEQQKLNALKARFANPVSDTDAQSTKRRIG